ncbi:DNA adenine methylase [Proteiniphilum sp.]|uniref:DNA adenine methylase n=1 Tax=Proteiniphilum sp. TaxID=1926877 RepID=UPI002B1FA262|nr:DNA adenine methylase [Proteiniphilum sp.]MEA4916303.1 DNA adenine methylase [Proteiniphilum sp.]
MRTPITYYGGKQTMLKHIVPLIPAHNIYVESFAGGAAVFFAKQPSQMDVINDLNGELINFYRTIVSNFDELKKEIDRTLHSRFQHETAWFIYEHPDYFSNVQRAWAVWVLSKMGFAGQLSNSFGFDKSEGRQAKKVDFAKEAFTVELKRRLEATTIESDDAFRIIARYDTPDTFHFIDPPYVGSDMAHYAGMFDEHDLDRLLQLCVTLQGKFMLTMYPNDNIHSYADRFGWIIHTVERQLSASKKIESRRKQEEWIVCNYPEPTRQGELNLFAA